MVPTYLTPMLQVFDMPRSLHFYCDLLGFEIVEKAGPENDIGWVWLRLNNLNLMLNTAYELPGRPSSESPARIAAHRDTVLYFGTSDVDAIYHDFASKGLSPEPPKVASYGMKQMYLNDPDGFVLCFQCPAN